MRCSLKITTLRVSFQCLKQGILPPYLGSTVRGIMGHCFRKKECTVSGKKCFLCDKRDRCLYVKYFSNTGKEGGAINPYAISVRQYGRNEWQVGDECEFDLTLFGYAAENAEIYLDIIQKMETLGWGVSRIPFKLIRISDSKTGQLIYVQNQVWKQSLVTDVLNMEERNANKVLISFNTPLRIVIGKELCRVPSFPDLIQFIVRRLALISQVHMSQTLDWEEEVILKAANDVKIVDYQLRDVNFERYSINQKENKLELPAVEGWGLYEGSLKSLVPILEIGKYIHVGKGATIGFGRYETFYDV